MFDSNKNVVNRKIQRTKKESSQFSKPQKKPSIVSVKRMNFMVK